MTITFGHTDRDRNRQAHCSICGHKFAALASDIADGLTISCPSCLKSAAEQETRLKAMKLEEQAVAMAAPLSLKFVKLYMRYAKKVAEENKACLSRQIGVVLVKVYPEGDSNVVSTGYNGPPKKTPHCDSREYLEKAVWPKLYQGDKDLLRRHLSPLAGDDHGLMNCFLDKYSGCKTCPRRLVAAKSGERLELCSCEHAEANAVYNAGTDLHGTFMFCWCPVPCWDCGKAIINAGVKRVFCMTDPSYGVAYDLDRTRFLLDHAKVGIFIAEPDFYLSD